jgi:hypothetical protein
MEIQLLSGVLIIVAFGVNESFKRIFNMNKHYILILSLLIIICCNCSRNDVTPAKNDGGSSDTATVNPVSDDLYSDTWVATDGLGRAMPTSNDVGTIKKDKNRKVGIFYVSWHRENKYNLPAPYAADVTKVLDKDPSARFDINNTAWGTCRTFHWGEPESGYFLSQDEYVIRKDISMLTDAGIDVLILDVTNGTEYWDEWNALFSTMQKMQVEGNSVPQFCFWCYNGNTVKVVQDLYDKVYGIEKYKNLWFILDNKPLLLYNANPDSSYGTYSSTIKSFFTLRNMWWGYYKTNGKRYVGTEDNWSFGYNMNDPDVASMAPRELIAKHEGRLEEAAVTPAQHASTTVGKCWRRNTKEPTLNEKDLPSSAYVPWLGKTVTDNSSAYGIYFQDRWDEAITADPDFIYLNDWNEWIAGQYKAGKSPDGKSSGPTTFLGRTNTYYFVDQYNAEFNRTIGPMKDGYTDNYYMQMIQNIRKYKGVRSIPECKGIHSVKIDGSFDDWKSISPYYYDTKGDIVHRDHNGYGGNHYTNTSGRNDIIYSKVAVDSTNVYFYVETSNTLSSYTGSNWMLLLIDADKNSSTGWYGYDYLINKEVKSSTVTTIKKYNESTSTWDDVSDIFYAEGDKKIEIAIPRKLLRLTGDSFTFDFKWADNPADLDSPISLCINGDTAPNRRFNYRCIWNK